MAKQITIAAAMRSAKWGALALDVEKLEKAGVDMLHFDAGDGHFISEITGSPEAIAAIKKTTKLPIELHLMVERPEVVYKKFREAGVDTFIIHIESTTDIESVIKEIEKSGANVALTLNPQTPFSLIRDALHLVKKVSVMTVNPGVGGILVESAIPKLKEISEYIERQKMDVVVQVDGAVSLKTRDILLGAGATSFVVGYPIFSREDYSLGVKEIKTGHA